MVKRNLYLPINRLCKDWRMIVDVCHLYFERDKRCKAGVTMIFYSNSQVDSRGADVTYRRVSVNYT